MKNKSAAFRFIFITSIVFIIFPLLVLAVWSIAESWRFPHLLPQSFSARGLDEIFGSTSGVISILMSSIFISTCVAILSTAVGTLTARAIIIYEFRFKNSVLFFNLLPLMIPAAAFTMGVHVTFIKLGLSDTVLGVIIIHLICSLPYSVNIMTDITSMWGKKLEEQAILLGATPLKAFKEVSFYTLLPGFITSFCMAYIISLSQYFITLIIGGGNVQTISTLMVPYIQGGDRTISGAYSVVFILSTLILFGIVEKISKNIGLDRSVFLQ